MPLIATTLSLCAEIARLIVVSLLRQAPCPHDTTETYLMAIVSALKAQLKCDMYQEAQVTADKADELIAYMKVNQPGVFSYYNWRMKLVHAQLVLNFGAFVKPGAFEFTETSK